MYTQYFIQVGNAGGGGWVGGAVVGGKREGARRGMLTADRDNTIT